MTFDRSDFSRIGLSLAAAVAMILAGAALVWWADQQSVSAARQKLAADSQRNEYEGKLRQVRAEETDVRKKAEMFNTLRSRGVIGEEQRLDWVELIKEIRESRKLLDVQYEIAPQKPIENAAVTGYSFRSSRMQLRMKLLHEGDLLNFINDLRAQAKAYVRVRSCKLARIPASATGNALLSAECELDWITILPTQEGK